MNNIGSLMFDAATLMITGMGFVFLFLTMLVYLVTLMAKIVPQEQPVTPSVPSKAKPAQSTTEGTSPQVVAAIAAAVKQYRSSAATK